MVAMVTIPSTRRASSASQGYERVCLQLSECNVLGVVRLGPPQLLGEVPAGPTP